MKIVDFNENNYAAVRELFYEKTYGTSGLETFYLSFQCPLSLLLNNCIEYILGDSLTSNIFPKVCIEFITIVIPIIIAYSGSSWIYVINLITIILSFVLYFTTKNNSKPFISPSITKQKQELLSNPIKPYLTESRGYTMISTTFAILAVDFVLFPRKYAKTQEYGYSLMDLGVGMCILGSSLTYKYLIKNNNKKISISYVLYILRGSLPSFFIGLSRYILYQFVNYPGETTAYGLEWNFFYTICTVRIVSEIIIIITLSIFKNKPISVLIMGIVIICLYQYYLCDENIIQYIFYSERNGSFFNRNREGILQCNGYIALNLIGTYFGYLIQNYYKNNNINNKIRDIGIGSIILICFFISNNYIQFISRRLMNLSYLLYCLFCYYSIYVVIMYLQLYICNYKESIILKSFNYNMLIVFLISNIFTGYYNINFTTIFMNNRDGYTILVGYMITVVIFSIGLWYKNIKIRF